MADLLFYDDMKKESNNVIFFGILFYVLIFMLIVRTIFFTDEKILSIEDISLSIIYFSFGNLFVILFLSGKLYYVKVFSDEIKVRKFFLVRNIKIESIIDYTVAQHFKSKWYNFKVFYGKKRILISTKKNEQFSKILNDIVSNNSQILINNK